MEYSRKVAMTLALVLFAMAAAGVQVATAQNSEQDFVDLHNAARRAVGVGDVTWDDTVAAYAQSYADQRSGDCQLIHTPAGRPYGENLFGGGAGKAWSAADAMESWMDEKQYYDYATNTCSSPLGPLMCGHYRQVVWRSSTAIGCARVVCNNGGVFIMCSYNPPGNYPDQRPY